MIFPLVADRVGICLNADFDQLFTRFGDQIDIGHDPQRIADLVGQIFEQLVRVRQADGLSLIVASNDQHTALSIGKAANPFQELVPP